MILPRHGNFFRLKKENLQNEGEKPALKKQSRLLKELEPSVIKSECMLRCFEEIYIKMGKGGNVSPFNLLRL